MQPFNAMRTKHLQNCLSKGGSAACWYSALGLSITLAINAPAHAEEFFNPSFLSDNPEAVADLSRFDKGEGQAPGSYLVETYLNGEYVATRNITFIPRQHGGEKDPELKPEIRSDDSGLSACMTRIYLEKLGVNIQEFPLIKEASLVQCINLEQAIPQASETLDFEKLRLNISIPQAALKNSVRGYIPPEEWDEGISALLLNYNFTGGNMQSRHEKGVDSNYFLNLNSGLNLGGWRLRNYSTWNYSQSSRRNSQNWQNISTYAQRTIVPIKSSVTLGDSYTPSDIFNSVGFRGIQLESDDNMLPDSLRGFAPTIRCVANSNAKITVKQNGYVIYQTYVPPGAFTLSDLYATSSSGDLQVTVAEANGTENSFSVPYSAVPVLQREGRIKYSLTAGQYRSNNSHQDKPVFGQGTLIWGLPGGVTLYGGSQLANNYRAFALGSGINLGHWGAVSADLTQANSVLPDESRHQGQSLRFLFAKSLNELGTNFQLLGYRYSTQGFYTLDETAYSRMSGYTIDTQDGPVYVEPTYRDYYNLNYTKKGRVQVNISQQLGTYGSIFLSGSRQTYWYTDQTNDLWQLGYSAYLNDLSYNLTYSYNQGVGYSEADKRIALNVSLPIGKWLSNGGKAADITHSNNTAHATYAANADTKGRVTQQTGVSGTLLDRNNLSYGVQQGYGNHGVGANGGANLNYRGPYGNSNIAYGYSKDYRQVNYGLSGGLIGHANGVTLSQPLGDTNVLIKAPGASGVSLENSTGISTDWRGYAVVPYATAYRLNRVALDTTTLKDNADLEDAVANVVPTQGALVRAEFTTLIGVRALITLIQVNGKPVPFGASVSRDDEKGGGIVGDNGQVYLSGLPLDGHLLVKWGNAADQTCRVAYSLPQESQNKAISYTEARCQ